MAEIIDCRVLANKIKNDIKNKIECNGLKKTLGIFRIGDDAGSISYENGVIKSCKEVGAQVHAARLPYDASFDEAYEVLSSMNKSKDISGILLLKPLPKHIDEEKIISLLSPEKDIDCLSPYSYGRFLTDDSFQNTPCTASAVIKILEFAGISLSGKKAVVVGRSLVVGKPLALMLLKENATVTICHSKTKDIAKEAKDADILVSASGCPNLIGEDIAKNLAKGAVAIDVGTSFFEGSIHGDFDFEAVQKHVSMITEVKGGVGAVTNSVLLEHLLNTKSF